MKIAVSRRLGIPLITQIRDQIITAISVGDLRPGDRLPTIRQLAEFLDLNRNTVAQVYRLLEQEGFVVTRGSGGTIVSDSAATRSAIRSRALRELVREAIRTAEASGHSAHDFAEFARYEAAQWRSLRSATVLVLDEYEGELDYLCRSIRESLPGGTVHGMLLDELARAVAGDPAAPPPPRANFALVPFYCLDRAQSLLAGLDIPVLATGIGPSMGALRRIAEETRGQRVAIVCTDPAGPRYMERALQDAGITFHQASHGHLGQPDLAGTIAQSDVVIASHGSVETVRSLRSDQPVITYSALLSEESLATIRRYAEHLADPPPADPPPADPSRDRT